MAHRHKIEQKLVDIQNVGLDLGNEVSEANMLHNEDTQAFAEGNESLEVTVMFKARPFFYKVEQRAMVSLVCESKLVWK